MTDRPILHRPMSTSTSMSPAPMRDERLELARLGLPPLADDDELVSPAMLARAAAALEQLPPAPIARALEAALDADDPEALALALHDATGPTGGLAP
jgi:hypothetical protein